MWWVWVIAVLGGLVLLLVLVLSVPLEIDFQLDVQGRQSRSRMRMKWLFDLVGWNVEGRRRTALAPAEQPERAARVPERRDWRRTSRKVIDALRTQGLMGRLKDFVADAIHSLKVRDLAVDLKIALGNPYETGLLFAVLAPLSLFLNSLLPYHTVSLHPDFHDAFVLQGYARGMVRIMPILVVAASLRFAFSRPVLKIARKNIAEAWRERKR